MTPEDTGAQNVFKLLSLNDPEKMRAWEPDLQTVRVHKRTDDAVSAVAGSLLASPLTVRTHATEFSDELFIMYTNYSAPYPVTGREFVTVRGLRVRHSALREPNPND
jgi:hypothetical protein